MYTLTAASGWFTGDIPARLQQARENGFKAMEVLNWKGLDLAAVLKAEQSTGVAISAILFQSVDETKQELIANTHGIVHEDALQAFIDAMQETIAAAKALQVKNIVVTTGNERADVCRSVQHDNVVKALQAVVPLLEDADMTAVLEPLNILVNHKGYYLTTTAEAAQIITQVGSPRVRILYDVYHQQITEGNLIDTINANIGLIGHIHIGDVPGRKEPGTGEINYKNVFAAINATGYTGYVVFECGLSEDVQTVCKKMWALQPDR